MLVTTPVATKKGPAKRATLRERASELRGRASAFLETIPIIGTENIAVRLKRSKKGLTKVDLAVELDLGGHVSKATKLEFIKRRLNEVGEVAIYFHRLVPLEGLIEEVRFLKSEARDVRARIRY